MGALARPADAGMTEQQGGERIVAGLADLAWRALWTLCVLTVLTLAIIIGGNHYGARMVTAGLTASTEPVRIVIGSDLLHVPANAIRAPEQRRDGAADRLDLKVHWPDRSGFRGDLVAAFGDTDPDSTQIVLLTIAQRYSLLDMPARLGPVYHKALVERAHWRSAGGLHLAPLRGDLGYVDEMLVFSPTLAEDEPAFIARCQNSATVATPLVLACETDLFFGESIEARVRFPASFLADWRRFGPDLRAYIDTLLVAP